MKNKLIVFEGIDGVGKSTLCASLKRELLDRGIKVLLYEDFEKKIQTFDLLKSFIKQKVKPVSIDASLYFYLSSALYKSEIIKKLLKSHWVICDRYIYSTIADHVVGGASKAVLPDLKSFPFLKPDVAFLVTTSDKVRLARVKKRKVVNEHDLVPVKPGTRAYKMEKEYRKMGLIRINNDGTVAMALNQIFKEIFKR